MDFDDLSHRGIGYALEVHCASEIPCWITSSRTYPSFSPVGEKVAEGRMRGLKRSRPLHLLTTPSAKIASVVPISQ